MERQGDEVHITTEEARAGSTPHIVRYVLGFGLVLAIAAMAFVWSYFATRTSLNSSGQAASPQASASPAPR